MKGTAGYQLFGGEAIIIENIGSLSCINDYIGPIFKDCITDNWSKFMGEIITIHRSQDFIYINLNYGVCIDRLNIRDTSDEMWNPILHKHYPLFVGRNMVTRPGNYIIKIWKENACINGPTVIENPIFVPGDSEKITIDMIHSNEFGDITNMAMTDLTKEDIQLLKDNNLLSKDGNIVHFWTNDESSEDARNSRKRDHNTLTGKCDFFTLELDTTGFDKCRPVFIRDAIRTKCPTFNDFPKWLIETFEDSGDYAIKDIMPENHYFSTSILLTDIKPDNNDNVSIKIANKTIADWGDDYGWFY